jgi:iron-sulfur cluster assembly protein
MSAVTSEQIAQAFVLNLTDEASAKIQSILKERNVPNHGLRVFVAGGGCSGLQYGMALESQAQDTDQVLQVAGVKLFVDPTSAEYLDGATIDYQDDPMNSGFRIENPNAAPTCGCGSSSDGCGCR